MVAYTVSNQNANSHQIDVLDESWEGKGWQSWRRLTLLGCCLLEPCPWEGAVLAMTVWYAAGQYFILSVIWKSSGSKKLSSNDTEHLALLLVLIEAHIGAGSENRSPCFKSKFDIGKQGVCHRCPTGSGEDSTGKADLRCLLPSS